MTPERIIPLIHETAEDQPHWHDPDDFAAARGMALGVCLGLAVWAVIGAVLLGVGR